jgi:hypothetical protein
MEEATLGEMFGGNQLHILMSLLFSLMILLPALYQLHVWMKK